MLRFSSSPRVIIFMAACLLAALACQPPGTAVPAGDATEPSVTAQPPAPTLASGEAATAAPLEADIAYGPGDFDLLDPSIGLASLTSYRASLNYAFEGTHNGQPAQWSRTYVMLTSREPARRQLNFEATGGEAGRHFWSEADGALFERRGEGPCTAALIPAGGSLAERWELTRFISGVIGADEAGSETINGVATHHYTFDGRAFGSLDSAQSVGEMWVAAEGGYVARYRLATAGGADFFGEGIEGTLTWNYALTDVNQAFTVDVPADCPAGLVDAPRLPDAADLSNMPGLLSYSTGSTPVEAAAYYEVELPAVGWQPSGNPVTAETLALHDFTRDAQRLSVIITGGNGSTTNVRLVLGPTEPK